MEKNLTLSRMKTLWEWFAIEHVLKIQLALEKLQDWVKIGYGGS